MSAVGLPMPHMTPHFDVRGMCICPCGECTTRPGWFCLCADCPCDSPNDHAATGEPFRWHILSACPDESTCPIHGPNQLVTYVPQEPDATG